VTGAIGQTIEQPGFFTKDELEGVAEYITEREQEKIFASEEVDDW